MYSVKQILKRPSLPAEHFSEAEGQESEEDGFVQINTDERNEIRLTAIYPDSYWLPACSIPKEVLRMGLKPGTLIVYGLLLTRAVLSKKNHWTDASGRVFVYYPIENLSRDSGRSATSVKISLRELSDAGLIIRERRGFNRPNRIFVCIPVSAGTERRSVRGSPESPEESPFEGTDGHNVCLSEGQTGDRRKDSRPSPNIRGREKDLSEYMRLENDLYGRVDSGIRSI